METFSHQEEGYFTLIERVGSKGRYQRRLLMLFYLIWFITAFVILSLTFILMPSQYECQSIQNSQQCRKWICSKSQNERSQFIKSPGVSSFTHQYYQCQDETMLPYYKMSLFIGIFVGFIVFSYFSDNFGRRKAMILTWITALTGILLICYSRSLIIASIGLFLAGSGCQSNLRVNLALINEMVDYHLRQVYSVILQSAFGVAGISIAVSYYLLYDWRIVTIFFCGIPALLAMVLIIVTVEQTPLHLYAKGSKQVLDSLKRISTINGLDCDITQQQITSTMQARDQNDKLRAKNIQVTLFDLFHYGSLREKTIYLCLMLFFIASLYIGPNSILQTFKVDIFWLQVILSLPDCIVYPLASHYIVNIERRKAGLKYLGLASLLLFIIIFLNNNEECSLCFATLLKFTLLFISRCCISFYYGLYPEQVRNIGFGTVSAAGALGSTVVQKLLRQSNDLNHNPFIYLFIFSLFCLVSAFKLPQTHGNPLQVQIQQLRKKKQNKKYQPSLQQSYGNLDLSSESERHTDQSSK